MWIIYSTDTEKAESIVSGLYPGHIEIMYRKCRFTEEQLLYTIDELEKNPYHYYIDMYIDYEKNRVILSVSKWHEKLKEWIDSLRYSECVYCVKSELDY